MITKNIIEYLKQNGLYNIEELKKEKDLFLVRFYYNIDSDILEGAKDYANSESTLEEESKEWYTEYFIPYLYDFANDEVLEIVEEIVEDNNICGEFMAFQLDLKSLNKVQFVGLFTEKDSDISIEDVVKEFIC